MFLISAPHLSLFSWDWASSICVLPPGGREMEFWIRVKLDSRTRIRGPRSPSPTGREGNLRENLSRAKLRFCLWASMAKKQEGHVSQPGKESQWPRLHESQRVPLTPGRHKQAPVCLLQTSGSVPSASQRHAVEEETRKETHVGAQIGSSGAHTWGSLLYLSHKLIINDWLIL